MKSCIMCQLPMVIPYAYCTCEGRSYYCAEHVERTSRCSACNEYYHYYLISIPVVLYVRKYAWLQPFFILWSLLWVVVLAKLVLMSYQWILALTLLEWILCIFGLSFSLLIGFAMAKKCLHLKRDSDPCPGMDVVAPLCMHTSISLPVSGLLLVIMYYFGVLLLYKFPVDGMQPFVVGCSASVVTIIVILGMYVCARSVY